MNPRLKRTLSCILSVVVGFALLGGVLYYVGWRSVVAEIVALHWTGVAAVGGTVLLGVGAGGLSWWVILRSYGVRLPWRHVAGAWLASYAVTYLTPTLYFGGEPVRALLVADRSKAPGTRIFATIVVERVLGGLALVLFILMGSFYALVSPKIAATEKRVVLFGAAFVSFWILVGLVNFAGNFKWISRLIRLLGIPFRRWERGFARAADKVSETEDEIHTAFTVHWKGTALAFLIQLFAALCAYMRPQVFFHFSASTTFDFAQLSLLFTLNILMGFFLWITPGGVGTSEAALIGIYRLVGVGKEGAVAFSLIFKVFEFAMVGVGLAYTFSRGIGSLVRRLHEKARRERREDVAP
jgi:uncharacterized protein (TIRG00374 family)